MATAETHDPAGLPKIRVNDRQLSEIVREAGEILVASNKERLEQAAKGVERQGGVPVVFVRSGGLVRLAHRDHDVSISMMDRDTVHAVITRISDWFRVTDNGMFPVFPPRDVSRDLLTLAPKGLPVLESVISTPVFGAGGDLIDKPGHHAQDRLWLQPSKALKLRAVSKKPSRRQVDDARNLILDELLSDFPFAHPADRAGAMAALFLPFVRRMITGPTPLHLVEAPTPGSGKSLLCNLISIVAIGAAAEARTLPDQEEEVRKMLTAELSRARPIILLDNATERKKIDSSALASIATSEVWTDRLLGSSKMLSLKNNALWMLTANNPRISNELTRRCIRIRVDPRQDRPWQREGFKHDPITEWTRKERPKLVHAALTLAQAWVAEGSPSGTIRLGSFEGWSAVMGGLLQVAGVDGFLANLNEFYAQADTEGEAWREFIAAWWQEFGGQGTRISELNDLCEREGLMNSVRGDKSARSQQSRLGRALQNARDRVFDTLRLQLAMDSGRHRGRFYQLAPVEGQGSNCGNTPAQGNLWDKEMVPFAEDY